MPPKTKKVFELNEANIERFLEQHDTGLSVPIGDLEFPLNDSSYGVQDFREWKYFKDMVAEKFKTINIGHTFLWNNDTLEKIRKQGQYKQFVEPPKISIVKQTKIDRLRLKRAKAMLAKWNGKKSTTMYTTGNKYPGAEIGSPSSSTVINVVTNNNNNNNNNNTRRSRSPSKTRK